MLQVLANEPRSHASNDVKRKVQRLPSCVGNEVEDEKEYLCMDKEKVVEAPQHISLIAICTPAVVSRLISGR